MPTFRAERKTARAQAGFTLLELIAVLAILSLAAAAVMQSSGRGFGTTQYRAFLVRTTALLAEGRADAMSGMTESVFMVDVRNRRMGYSGRGPAIELPKEVELRAILAKGETRAGGAGGIRFYPTGGSSGGTLRFGYRGMNYEIRVNWLTGHASTHRI